MLCPRSDQRDELADEDPNYRPSVEEPLVYHLFGHLRDPDSVVLTQDDYFDYLIDITRNNEIIPKSVRANLANTALLFLGFQMSDWDFRVFFRSIISQEDVAGVNDSPTSPCKLIRNRNGWSTPTARDII